MVPALWKIVGGELGFRCGLGWGGAATWRQVGLRLDFINLLKQFLQNRLDLSRCWHQALTSLNENVREKKAALAVKHAWRQHVLTIVTERPTAFCCHLFGRQSRSSKEAACRGAMSGTSGEMTEPENFEPGKMPVLNINDNNVLVCGSA